MVNGLNIDEGGDMFRSLNYQNLVARKLFLSLQQPSKQKLTEYWAVTEYWACYPNSTCSGSYKTLDKAGPQNLESSYFNL